MKVAILSDIHANLTALNESLSVIQKEQVEGLILLGDHINYGMRPSAVIERLQTCGIPIVANIWGNHEKACLDNDTSRFSTERGKASLEVTRSLLDDNAMNFLIKDMHQSGELELALGEKSFYLVHGKMGDPFWGKFLATDFDDERYARYDYVLTGHSHVCHYVEKLFAANAPETRNKKKTIFINPGSVGQPRNLNPHAQFGILDTETSQYVHYTIPYDIAAEQALYTDERVDPFYKTRLSKGI